MTASRVATWLPVAVWAAVIFTLSAIPDLSTGLGVWDVVLRKLAHVAEYAILGALVVRALRREPSAIAFGSAYAATDEIHQTFVAGRHGSPVDWALDTAAVALGVLVFDRFGR